MLESSRIEINGVTIYFNIKRKKIKNMYMKFSEDGVLHITVPNNIEIDKVDNFIRSKINWIMSQKKQLEKIAEMKESINFNNGDDLYFLGKKYNLVVIPDKKNKVMINESKIEISIKERLIGDREYKRKIYEKWLKSQCLSLCTEYIEFYYEKMKKYNVPFPKINAKNFKARWGCCIPNRNQVEFAINLVKAPRECVEYVVVHELAHFKYIHHDEKFYEFVSIFIPDWKKRRDSLNRVYGRIIG